MTSYPWYWRGGKIFVGIDLTEHLKDPNGDPEWGSNKYVRRGLAEHLREHGYTVTEPQKKPNI